MPPFRSKDFWQKFDRNILMLDLLKRKLQNDATIIEVAQPFSRTMRDGELLAIEFISHLAGFCQELVDWYDEPRLCRLDRKQLQALFRVIKSVKTAVEDYKDDIICQTTLGQDPVAYYEFYRSDIDGYFSRFREKIQGELQRRAPTTSREDAPDDIVQGSSTRPTSTSEPVDRKPSPRIFSDSDSDTSESDDSDHPFRKVPKKPVIIQHDNKEEKPQIVSSKETSPEALIDAQSELPDDDDNRTPAETRPLSSPPIKPESEPETEPTTISIEQKKVKLINTHELNENVLGDLWISHQVLKSNQFTFTGRMIEYTFRLTDTQKFSYPRFDSLPSSLPSTMDEDERKALPVELVIIVEIELLSTQTTENPFQFLNFTFNSQDVSVLKSHQDGSKLKMILPVHPEHLKVGVNKIKMKQSKEMRPQKTTKGRLSVEVITMVSEKEVFEQSIRGNCSNSRTTSLYESSSLKSLLDPISGQMVRCPVRSGQCQHWECFDLKNIIQQSRFKSSWTCPFETCKMIFKPIELEFDPFVLENIEHNNQLTDKQNPLPPS
ncbi:hypothetical protein PGT21_024536 [Puccinia graminis f. sp. tritici]|uniref:SP-RING-type domain-containing protein n=1 Tax=Puccinia graminis f. sp. tritici TaxID=56615 RepID=A0A5B0PHI0_PUCGR|nr:hypothetical protein PGT21_024536 [Puccinia graminis f. sp. tritici]KAA1123473.1 hypothetical protein PGTUg99_017604 [Puccinia graminis f. sp. tritici]